MKLPRKPIDLTGEVFDKLTVLKITDERNSYGRTLYECVCECGNPVYATASNLKRGEIKMCKSCRSQMMVIDLKGQRFGKLTVIQQHLPDGERKNRQTHWLCKCDCGNENITTTGALRSGAVSSCGCLVVEKVKSLYTKKTAPCKLKESENPRKTNTSGTTGVSWDKSRYQWTAELTFQGRKVYLGRFDDKEEAIKARKKGEEEYFEKFLKEMGIDNEFIP